MIVAGCRIAKGWVATEVGSDEGDASRASCLGSIIVPERGFHGNGATLRDGDAHAMMTSYDVVGEGKSDVFAHIQPLAAITGRTARVVAHDCVVQQASRDRYRALSHDPYATALLGGLVLGLLSSFLESLLGLTMPIVPEEETALRRHLEAQARGIGSLVVARRAAELEQQALAREVAEQKVKAAEPTAPDLPAPKPDELSPLPAEAEREPADLPAGLPDETTAAAGPGLEPESAASSADKPAEEQEEDRA